jgi:hypothetical protein
VRGTAHLVASGEEGPASAIAALCEKYDQYERHRLEALPFVSPSVTSSPGDPVPRQRVTRRSTRLHMLPRYGAARGQQQRKRPPDAGSRLGQPGMVSAAFISGKRSMLSGNYRCTIVSLTRACSRLSWSARGRPWRSRRTECRARVPATSSEKGCCRGIHRAGRRCCSEWLWTASNWHARPSVAATGPAQSEAGAEPRPLTPSATTELTGHTLDSMFPHQSAHGRSGIRSSRRLDTEEDQTETLILVIN